MGHHAIAQAGSFKGMYWTPLDSKYDQRQDVKTVKVRFGREMLCSLFSQKKSLFSQTKIKIWCVTAALLDGVITQSSHCVRIHAHQNFSQPGQVGLRRVGGSLMGSGGCVG
jgi:hypothetical protein